MAIRPRISITMHEPWEVYLRWLAAERAQLPAELARQLLEEALEASRGEPDLARRYALYVCAGGDDPDVVADVVAALSTPYVPAALADFQAAVPKEAQRAARYLGLLSVWLSDERPRSAKGAPPRLADVLGTARVARDVGPALAYAGGADGQAIRGGARGGRSGASDKRVLSDIGGAEVGEGTHERA